ncbi:MAG TPA: DMT family transporter [Patescibacteria group bacterium]|nr:DMT family transporter [Patescibacteria group bacterium]
MLQRVSQQTKGWLYGIFSQILWGTGGVTIKFIDAVLPSSLLVGIRHGIGALTLGLLILQGKRMVFRNLPIIHLILLGIFAAGLPDLLLVEAVRRAGAIISTILARVEIPLGVLFAHLFLKEKVGKEAYFAGIISILGVCLISYTPEQTISLDNQFYIGVLCGLGAAVLWALSSVYAKYILNKQTDPLALSFVRLCIGSIFALAITLFFIHDPFISLQQLHLIDWILILYLGIFLSGLAYLFFYRSLHLLHAHVAIILIGLSIIVLLVAGLAIGETMRLLQWIGVGMIVFSIFLVKKSAPQK